MEDRPIECACCRKKTQVVYKEIKDGKMHVMKMCKDCPIYQEKLGMYQNEIEDITCDLCHTTLSSIYMGNPLGCSKCYSAFEKALIKEFQKNKKLPPAVLEALEKDPNLFLYLRKASEKTPLPTLTKQAEDLQTSLNEALEMEDYEKAADIRDALKKLTNQDYGPDAQTA